MDIKYKRKEVRAMRQTSEAFGKAMLELEEKNSPVSFSEQLAKVEEQMTQKINQMQDKLLSEIASANKTVSSNVELTEVTEETEVIEETENNENNLEEEI